jgi:hypothetical protein
MRKLLFVLLAALFLLTACGDDQVEIDGEMVKLDELKEMVAEEQQTLSEVEEEINSKEQKVLGLEIEFQDREAEFNELIALSEERESLEDEVIQLRIERDDLNREIEKLTAKVVEVKDEPIKVGAGYFYFGDDIEPGRYLIKPQNARGGNVFVRRNGSSYVNVILRESDDYPSDFVFESISGDELEVGTPVELYPVE